MYLEFNKKNDNNKENINLIPSGIYIHLLKLNEFT